MPQRANRAVGEAARRRDSMATSRRRPLGRAGELRQDLIGCCRMTQPEGHGASPAVSTSHRVSRIAHRAGNTRSAMRAALAAGADWMEVDLWYSLGRLVARHERGFGRLPIVYDRWRVRVLRETIVELEELCRLTRDGPGLFIDLKGTDRRLPDAIIETLRRNDAVDRAAVCGQFWPPLDDIGRAEPRLKIYHSLARPEHVLRYAPRLAAEGRLDGVSVGHWLVTPELVQRYAERGLQVFAWTVNEPELASRLVDAGVHGIISDRLELLAGLP